MAIRVNGQGNLEENYGHPLGLWNDVRIECPGGDSSLGFLKDGLNP